MNIDSLKALSDHFGVHASYNDFDGNQVPTSVDTQLAFLRANGLELDNDAMIAEAVQTFIGGERDRWFPRELITGAGFGYECNFGLGARWHIELDERISDVERDSIHADSLCGIAETHISLPPLPSGIHDLVCEVAGRTEIVTIISAPQHAPSIEQLTGKSRIWGMNAALYGLRSDRNSGLGDYVDLAQLSELVQDLGGSFLGINPVHTLGFSDPYAISPYSPSHRGFINTQHIGLDQFPGLESIQPARALLQSVETQWAELRSSEQVEYSTHRICHNAALRDLYTLFLEHGGEAARRELEDFRALRGSYLERFALFEALSEHYGHDWHSWPSVYKNHDESTLEQAKDRFAARIDFHVWLQWIASIQLAEAQNRASAKQGSLGLYLDLAVGARRGGAESWCEYDAVAHDVSLGAPPDQLGPDGQNWGLMAYAPRKLAANKYKSIRHIYRSSMRYAGVLRIDHVLGLNRSFWIPEDGSAGAYVSQPLDVLLAILAIEANASGCAVIGEDLGLVPDGFRDKVQSRGIYGYSVLQYEKWPDGRFKHPSELRQFSLACFSTHDTPTLKGYISGCDIKWRNRLRDPNQHASEAFEQRYRDVVALAALDPNASNPQNPGFDTLFDITHGALANSDVAMIAVQMDDILGLEEAQNLPGTVDQHPNWRRKYPVQQSQLSSYEEFTHVSAQMRESGRNLD